MEADHHVRDAPKVPHDDDGMNLFCGGFTGESSSDEDEDRDTIPRWMGNRRLLSQGRKGDLPNQ